MTSEFLSGTDIKDALKNQVKVIPYPELADYHNLHDLLEPYGRVVILYEQQPNVGHWCCLFYGPPTDEYEHTEDETIYGHPIYFFDPYGLKPDDEFDWIGGEIRKKLQEDRRYISQMLKRYPGPIDYNNHQLQSKKPGIATCGKWCVARLSLDRLDSDQFADLFAPEDGLSSDELVAGYYANLDGIEDMG